VFTKTVGFFSFSLNLECHCIFLFICLMIKLEFRSAYLCFTLSPYIYSVSQSVNCSQRSWKYNKILFVLISVVLIFEFVVEWLLICSLR